jgi:hypothetical protein
VRKLGGGYASTVHLAIDKATGIQVAVKVYHRVKLSQLNHYQVQREIKIHAGLDHPNILRLVRGRGGGRGGTNGGWGGGWRGRSGGRRRGAARPAVEAAAAGTGGGACGGRGRL